MSKKSFWRVTFDTNPNDCNLHCIMCEHHSNYSQIEKERIANKITPCRMDFKLIETTIDTLVGSGLKEIIPSTMGEPLLYEHFGKIVALCRKHDIKLNLTTNGTFPGKSVEEWAHLIIPIASDVKISWNGATKKIQESIMCGSSYDKGLKNFKKFIEIRDDYRQQKIVAATITLQVTFMKKNAAEFPDLVRLAIDLGVDRIKGHHLWAHFSEIKNLSMRNNKNQIDKWNKIVGACHEVANKHLLANGKKIKLENFDFLTKDAVYNLNSKACCPFLGKEAWILPTGEFRPCCAPEVERIKLGDFGNLHEKSLMEIKESPEYEYLCKHYMEHSVCIACNMRRIPCA